MYLYALIFVHTYIHMHACMCTHAHIHTYMCICILYFLKFFHDFVSAKIIPLKKDIMSNLLKSVPTFTLLAF